MRVTVEETAEPFEVLEHLEFATGELCAARVSEAELERIEARHAEMIAHHRHGRRPEYFARNQGIHWPLCQATRNATLIAAYMGRTRRIARTRYTANFSAARRAESAREHEAITAALRRRDSAALSALPRAHVRRTAESVVAAMRAARTRRVRP